MNIKSVERLYYQQAKAMVDLPQRYAQVRKIGIGEISLRKEIGEYCCMLTDLERLAHFKTRGLNRPPYATSVALDGKWKMLTDSLQPTELFDLAQDHRELYNLKGQHPEIEDKLLKAIQQFHQAHRESWRAVPTEKY